MQALETLIEAEMRLGHHAEVIVELRHLADAHPLREHIQAMLMLALYRVGRQAEALAVYRHASDVLAEEIGVYPSTELSVLHRRILNADPALDLPDPHRQAAAGFLGAAR